MDTAIIWPFENKKLFHMATILTNSMNPIAKKINAKNIMIYQENKWKKSQHKAFHTLFFAAQSKR